MRHFNFLVLLGTTVQSLNLWIRHTEDLIILGAPSEEFLVRFLIILIAFFLESSESHCDDRYWFTLVIVLNFVGNYGGFEELFIVVHAVDFVTNFEVKSPIEVISVKTQGSYIQMINMVSLNFSFVVKIKFDIYNLSLLLGVAIHVHIS